jgi:Flp pilus assembly pilin Flp
MNVMKVSDQKGQTLTEYALILLLIALVVAAAMPTISATLAERYTAMAAAFP